MMKLMDVVEKKAGGSHRSHNFSGKNTVVIKLASSFGIYQFMIIFSYIFETIIQEICQSHSPKYQPFPQSPNQQQIHFHFMVLLCSSE